MRLCSLAVLFVCLLNEIVMRVRNPKLLPVSPGGLKLSEPARYFPSATPGMLAIRAAVLVRYGIVRLPHAASGSLFRLRRCRRGSREQVSRIEPERPCLLAHPGNQGVSGF